MKHPFLELEPGIRAYALVGFYLQAWGLMEAKVNAVIGSALELDYRQMVIVTKNLQFRSKQKIIRTLVDITPLKADQKARFNKLAIDIGTESDFRNMVAHDLFGPSNKSDGVHFMVAKASAKLSFPDVDVPTSEILGRCKKLSKFSKELGELSALTSKSPIAEIIGASFLPTQGNRQQERSSLGDLLFPSTQGSVPQQTNRPKSGEKTPDRES